MNSETAMKYKTARKKINDECKRYNIASKNTDSYIYYMRLLRTHIEALVKEYNKANNNKYTTNNDIIIKEVL